MRKGVVNRIVRVILTEKVKCEKDLKEMREFSKWIPKSIPGRGSRNSKGPSLEVVMGDRKSRALVRILGHSGGF